MQPVKYAVIYNLGGGLWDEVVPLYLNEETHEDFYFNNEWDVAEKETVRRDMYNCILFDDEKTAQFLHKELSLYKDFVNTQLTRL